MEIEIKRNRKTPLFFSAPVLCLAGIAAGFLFYKFGRDTKIRTAGLGLVAFSGFRLVKNLLNPPPSENDEYFDATTGEFLGEGNTSMNNIRLISRKLWNETKLQPDRDKILLSKSQLLDDVYLSDVAKVNVANFYYQKAGYSLDELATGNITILPSENREKASVSNMFFTKTGPQFGLKIGEFEIAVRTDLFDALFRNKFDFINFFRHVREKHGKDFLFALKEVPNFRFKWQKHGWLWERRGVRFQVKDKSWEKTSFKFKEKMYEIYGRYEYIFDYKEQETFFGKYGIKVIPVE